MLLLKLLLSLKLEMFPNKMLRGENTGFRIQQTWKHRKMLLVLDPH